MAASTIAKRMLEAQKLAIYVALSTYLMTGSGSITVPIVSTLIADNWQLPIHDKHLFQKFMLNVVFSHGQSFRKYR